MYKCVVCEGYASYYDKNYNNFKFCLEHVNTNSLPIKYVTCQCPNCPHNANYGYYNEKPKYCENHKVEHMINVEMNKCCNCECIGNYIHHFTEKIYCKKHRISNTVKLRSTIKCRFCKFSNKYDYVCYECIGIKNKKQNAIIKYITPKLNYNILESMIVTSTSIHFEFITHSIVLLFEVYDTHIRRLYQDNHPLHTIIIEYKYVKKKLPNLISMIKMISEQTFHQPYFKIQYL